MLNHVIRPVTSPVIRSQFDATAGTWWSPLALFSTGEDGFWYAPSRLSSVWQSPAPPILVTAPGQTVGLLMDQSRGEDIGSDARSGFSSVVTGAASPAALNTVTGEGQVFRTNVSNRSALSLSATAGRAYLVSIANTAVSGQISIRTNGNATTVQNINPGESFSIPVMIQGSGGLSIVPNTDATNPTFTLSVCALVLGNHAFQATAGSRPLYQDWGYSVVDFDSVNDTLSVVLPNLGSDVTVAYASPITGAVVLTGQTIGAGTYSIDDDFVSFVVIDRALTASEIASLTNYLNAISVPVVTHLYLEGDSYHAGHSGVYAAYIYADYVGRYTYPTAVSGSDMAGVLTRVQAVNSTIRDGIFVLWDGSANGYTTLSEYCDSVQAVIDELGHDRFILIPESVPFGASAGTQSRAEGIRDEYEVRWPGHIVDWRDYIPNTLGVIDQSMMVNYPTDTVHLNAQAFTFMSAGISSMILENGW